MTTIGYSGAIDRLRPVPCRAVPGALDGHWPIGIRILHVDATHSDGLAERRALELVSQVAAQLADAFGSATTGRRVEGPHFVYDERPELFGHRHGRGPLLIAWDTNLLIDYFDHGNALWSGEAVTGGDPSHSEQLEALQLIMALWVVRVIRMIVLPANVTDAKKGRVRTDRQQRRAAAFAQFTAAITLIAGSSAPPAPPLTLPPRVLEDALRAVPEGGDRSLVRQAVKAGAQAFLTRDRKVLKAAAQLRPFGLQLASPQDLLELIAAAGGFWCLQDPRLHLHWPMPDLHRVTLLTRAIDAESAPPPARPTT